MVERQIVTDNHIEKKIWTLIFFNSLNDLFFHFTVAFAGTSQCSSVFNLRQAVPQFLQCRVLKFLVTLLCLTGRLRDGM